jgi:hypothetical protein
MAVPLRGPVAAVARPQPVAGLSKGMLRVAGAPPTLPRGIPSVQRYARQVGPFTAGYGLPAVPAPLGAGGDEGAARARLVQWLRTQRKPSAETLQVLAGLIGGPTPRGPMFQGYLPELLRILLAGA